MIEEGRGEGRFWATVAFAIVIIVGLALRQPSPAPLDSQASTAEFSAARARDVLSTILADERPHPTGTEENDRVRQRVVGALAEIGLEPTIEELLVCNDYGSCAMVRNVVAELRGRDEGPAVLLNAHYDSVPAGPGAGDDGAGVAVLLEVARALSTGPPAARSVRFLIDDAEEAGLLGAEAWRRMHPNDETLAVIVLEARGSSGPALMFETHSGNQEIVKAYAKAAPDPATSSVFFSIYERLPNRTNFTVFKRVGYRGMAIAFIEDPAHYHTPLNSLEHLSDRSLQHMGGLTLSLARELSNNGLAESQGNASYFDLLGATVVLWPEAWSVWMAVGALVLLSIVGVVAWKRELAVPGQVLAGWIVIAGSVLFAGALSFGVGRLAQIRAGSSDWTANGGLLVLAAWLLAAACATLPFTMVKRPPLLISIWISLWLVHAIIGVVLARLLPGAAYLFFIPALAAGLSGLVSLFGRRPDRNEGMIIVPFGVSLILVVPILNGLYDGLGLAIFPAIAAIAALQLSPLLVVSTEGRRTAMFAVACLGGAVVSVTAFFLTPVYSSSVPRAINVASVFGSSPQDTMVLLGSTEPLPSAIAGAAEWTKQPVAAFRSGWDDEPPRLWTAPIEGEVSESPDVSGSASDASNGDRIVRLVMKPESTSSIFRVILPDSSRPQSLAYGDATFPLERTPARRMILRGAPMTGVVLTVGVERGSEIEVIEERPSPGIAASEVAAVRSENEVPVGPGDRSLHVLRVRVDELPERLDAAPVAASPSTT